MKTQEKIPLIDHILGRARIESSALPALLSAASRAAHAVRSGEHSRRRAGTGEKFWQFRPYDPSDRPQDIDWRASGKGEQVYIREKERQTAQSFLFWTDRNPGMNYHSAPHVPSKHDTALILNLALAFLATEGGELVAPLADETPAGRSAQMLHVLGESLMAQDESSNTIPPSTKRSIPNRSTIILAGDFLSPPEQLESAFHNLAVRAGQGLVIQVLDPAEISLPFTGHILFEAHEGAERYDIPAAEAVKDEYEMLINSHIKAVENAVRRLGWSYILHSTDKKIEETLLAVWNMIGRRA